MDKFQEGQLGVLGFRFRNNTIGINGLYSLAAANTRHYT